MWICLSLVFRLNNEIGKPKNEENKSKYFSVAQPKKEIVPVAFDDDTEKSIPMSSEKNSTKTYEFSEIENWQRYVGKPEDVILSAISVSYPKLKRVFNFHIKNTHNKIDFSEFLKFWKSTQIFPNFISIINLKKIIQKTIGEEGKQTKEKKQVNNSTMITFKEFNRSIKQMAFYVLDNSAESCAGERMDAFLKHVNVNCQYTYNVNGLINENVEHPSASRTPKSLSSSLWDNGDNYKPNEGIVSYLLLWIFINLPRSNILQK